MIFNQQPPAQGGGGETHTVELQVDMKVLDWDTLTLVTTSPEFHEGDGVIVQYTGPFVSYDMVRTDTQETIPKLALRTGSTAVYAYVMPGSDIQPSSGGVSPDPLVPSF